MFGINMPSMNDPPTALVGFGLFTQSRQWFGEDISRSIRSGWIFDFFRFDRRAATGGRPYLV
jgi:hypothetical protein